MFLALIFGYLYLLTLPFHGLKISIVFRNSLLVQWLRLHASTAEVADSIPGWGKKDAACHTVLPKNLKIELKKIQGLPWWPRGWDCAANARGLGSVPGRGAEAHMPQLRVCMP